VDTRCLKMVTHVDVDHSDIQQALRVIAEVVSHGF